MTNPVLVSAGNPEHAEVAPVGFHLHRACAFTPCIALRNQHLLRDLLWERFWDLDPEIQPSSMTQCSDVQIRVFF